ncbi:MAG: hypothetical protein ABFD92_20545 [Planctomycetaceae bacterium]|nr:hypothetical protein [Planctomycetaceae bacterium]
MPDILVRDVNIKTLKRLKDRARQNGRSLQSEAKMLLEQAAGTSIAEALAAAAAIRTRRAGRKFSDSVKLIRQDRRR